MHIAADLIVAKACVDDLRMVIAEGANVNEPVVQGCLTARCLTDASSISLQCSGLRPLHYAAYANNMPAVKLLLVRGCDVDATDECGYSASSLPHLSLHQCRSLAYSTPVRGARQRRHDATPPRL